ncbi:(2Fe-2S)-binding protein [Streptomyces sp. TRM66268-LWL]|uniref:(2Fe-2S)-binding protein n=2 Tax=Streptomyces polyasparticus TaxID=2767826 RepID=A0ABR7SS04_9ACTN|nr:(2Fe-2S)-binding protein [Streptomyces polyasparticus]
MGNGHTGEGSYGNGAEASYGNGTDGSYGNGTEGSYGNGTEGSYGHGGWQPTSQGEYDGDATAFVALPEGFADTPLAAPGGSFVPPQISVVPGAAADPAATGTFVIPSLVPQMSAEHSAPEAAPAAPAPAPAPVQWPEPNAPQQPAPPHESGMTGQWSFTQPPGQGGHESGQQGGHESAQGGHEPVQAQPQSQPESHPQAPSDPHPHPQSQVTGQWSIPLAQGDLPDESGEFTTSSLVDQWADRAPATLPGGAPAPWAQHLPEPEPQPEEPAAQGEQRAEPAESAAPAAEQPADPDVSPQDGQPEPPAQEAAEDAEPSDGADPSEGAEPAAPVSGFGDEHPHASYVLRVNGADRPVTDAWIGESLLYVLRERLGLAGAKDGCSQGECGACAVQVDGRLVASCLVPAATAAGSEVRTVEGLAEDGQPSDVQRALAASCAVQCGFCVPGMAMTVHDLLEGNPQPTERETRQALCGNLCRCSGYKGVLEAVKDVVAERQTAASDTGSGDETEDHARIPHQAPPGAGGVNYPQDGGRS